MEKIIVNTSDKYHVFIGKNILNDVKEELKKNSGIKFLIITDDKVWPLHKDKFSDIFSDMTYDVFILKNGEKSKSLESYTKILDFMLKNSYSREDKIIAFGGGVVGDIAGFVASTFMRGIDFIQIPTTLLSCVDSSVGGKTGINYNGTKNILGAFKQPLAVFCDLIFLDTLNDDIFSEGVAEIIKYAILFDSDLLNELGENKLKKDDKKLISIVKKSIEFKAKIIEDDEFDNGMRKILNLGHTVAHAIEKISDNNVTHGFAVSMGLYFIAKLSNRLGYLKKNSLNLVEKALKINNLSLKINYLKEEIYLASISDKKRSSGYIEIILINDIGSCFIKKINLDEWNNYISLIL